MTARQGNVHNAADPPYEAFIRRIFAQKKKNVLAEQVGFKSPSAVSKRIEKLAGAYEDFVSGEYSDFLDKHTT